jgi:hypothetical protein
MNNLDRSFDFKRKLNDTYLGLMSLFREIGSIPRPALALVFGLATLVFVIPTFNQGDLNHTVVSSYGYLRGHFLDFYDFNKTVVGGNDYLPILYVIFALWMAPYYFLGLPVAHQAIGGLPLFPEEIIWAKLLLVIFFLLSVLLVFRISKLIHPSSPSRQAIATWAFTLSPFALFAFGVFSQYDILGVFFTLWAFHKLLQRKLTAFAVLIGVALTFKFFAALLVVPLVLLASKNFLQIIRLGFLASVPLILQLAAYWSNEAFRNQIFGLVTGKATGAATSSLTYIVAAIYIVMCLAATLSSKWPGTFEQKAVLFSVTAYGLMLSVVVWHPQWLIILTPFLALAVSMISASRTWLLLESILFLGFIGIVVTSWKYNVDGLMIERGALASFFSDPKLLVSDLYPEVLMSTFSSMMRVLFWAPPILLLIEIFRRPRLQERVGGFTWFARVASTWVAFIIPSFVAVYIPMDVAVGINRNAALTAMNKQVLSDMSQTPVAEIVKGVRVTQTFEVYEDNFSALSLQLATYARENSSFVEFSIFDQSGTLIHSEKIEARSVLDNSWFAIIFEPQADSRNKEYSLVITSGSEAGSAITAYSSLEDSIPEGSLDVSGVSQVGDLALHVYYLKESQ